MSCPQAAKTRLAPKADMRTLALTFPLSVEAIAANPARIEEKAPDPLAAITARATVPFLSPSTPPTLNVARHAKKSEVEGDTCSSSVISRERAPFGRPLFPVAKRPLARTQKCHGKLFL